MAHKKGDRWYEVRWSQYHHGQYVPDRPWCEVLRSFPGTPGEPSDGIRYMTSYADRERAIAEVAKARAFMSPRYLRAKAKLEAIFAEEVAKMTTIVDTETPKEGPE